MAANQAGMVAGAVGVGVGVGGFQVRKWLRTHLAGRRSGRGRNLKKGPGVAEGVSGSSLAPPLTQGWKSVRAAATGGSNGRQ